MNLIEQLGGYRMAKEVMDSIPKDGRSYTITRDDTGIIFNTSELHNALLEYRRAHNIFEMGDYIIHDGELKVFAMWSNAINGCAYIGYAYAEDGEMAHKDEFRHATDAEIEVEHRL